MADPSETEDVVIGYGNYKEAHVKRLHRIEGQIRGLQGMVKNDRYCIDILTQVSSATRALQSFSRNYWTNTWLAASSRPPSGAVSGADAKVCEASEAIARLVRS